MATLQDRDHDVSDYRERERAYNDREDREISLGTGTILGIFFALALLCAVFFGFGYSMGRKSVQTAISVGTPQTYSTGGLLSSFKPSAGSPAGLPVQAANQPRTEAQDSSSDAHRDSDSEIVTKPVTSSDDAPAAARSVVKTYSPKPATEALATNQSAPSAMPAINPNGTAVVQVAAVSHQEDADTLIAALKKKGYAVFIRQEPQDHLLRVQIGPFTTHKDADTMRQHLLADGYNAIVK